MFNIWQMLIKTNPKRQTATTLISHIASALVIRPDWYLSMWPPEYLDGTLQSLYHEKRPVHSLTLTCP